MAPKRDMKETTYGILDHIKRGENKCNSILSRKLLTPWCGYSTNISNSVTEYKQEQGIGPQDQLSQTERHSLFNDTHILLNLLNPYNSN